MMVNCDCCEQWFHTLCIQYSSTKKEEKFYCPLCICEEELQKTKEAIATIVRKYVNPEIEPIFKVIVPEKKKDLLPLYNSMDHKRDWETASDDYYYAQGEDYPSRLRNEIPTKRRKSERLSEKPRLSVPLEERVITFEDKKKKEIANITEPFDRSIIRTPNTLGDKDMNDFLKVIVLSSRVTNVEKWIIDITLNKSNIISLKILNPVHVNTLEEWMERVHAILQSSNSMLSISSMTKQQTLPSTIEFIFFEYLRLRLDYSHDCTLILKYFVYYMWLSFVYNTLETPREISSWKRIIELFKCYSLTENSLYVYVENVCYVE